MDLSSLQPLLEFLKVAGGVLASIAGLLSLWARIRAPRGYWSWWRASRGATTDLPAGSAVLRRFHRRRDALMRFRADTRVHVRTLEQAEALAVWCEQHGEDVDDVHACGRYFDTLLPGLRVSLDFRVPFEGACSTGLLSSRGLFMRILLAMLVSIACTVGALLATAGALPSGAIVSAKQGSGDWVWLYPDHFAPVLHRTVHVTAKDCNVPSNRSLIMRRTGLSQRDVSVFCGTFADPQRAKEISSVVRGQRIAFPVLGFLLLVGVWAGWKWLAMAAAAMNMRDRLRQRAGHRPMARGWRR